MNKTIYHRFLRNVNILKNVSQTLSKFNVKLSNSKLATAASRISVPRPFDPYIEYIEKSTGKSFPTDLVFTADEVRAEDMRLIAVFSTPNFDFTKLDLNLLIKSAVRAAEELGILYPGEYNHLPPEESAKRFQLTTSAGYPFFRKKGNPSVLEDAISWASTQLNNPSMKEFMTQPTAVFHRFQYKVDNSDPSNIKVKKKIRPVWGVPFRILVLEGVIFRNAIDDYSNKNIQSSEPVSPTGRTRREVSTDIVSRLRSLGKPISYVDYKSFDSTIPSFMWALFYSTIYPMINTEIVKPSVIDLMMIYHCFTPYCWNSTKIEYQQKGVPSGCLVTSVFDTWVNRVLINYTSLERTSGRHYVGSTACTLGDDLLFVEDNATLVHLVNVSKRFGMTIDISSSKTVDYDDIFDFLGYFWDSDNRPTQLEPWYIAHLCLPSRFLTVTDIPLSYLQTYRGISICCGLFGGMETFERLVGKYDFVWQHLLSEYKSGNDPIISYVGEDQRLVNLRIPLSIILVEGWEAF